MPASSENNSSFSLQSIDITQYLIISRNITSNHESTDQEQSYITYVCYTFSVRTAFVIPKNIDMR